MGGGENSEKSYYLSPIQSKNVSSSNIDLVTGKVSMSANDVRANKSGLGFSVVYNSYNDINQTLGTFTHSYQKSVDTNNSNYQENIKSSLYTTAKEACENGWADIDGNAFLGKLENTKAIYNENNTLCDIYDDSQIVASLLSKNKRAKLSSKLHTLTNPDGTELVFFKKDGTWESVSKNPMQFEVTDAGFKVTTLSDAIELYDKEGKLLSITNKGQTTSLTYDAKKQLEKITDAFAQTITLTYDVNSSRVKEVKSYDDTKVSYSYNDKKQLEKVTYADGSSKAYAYNENGDIISLKDASGTITKSIEYDIEGRAVSSTATNGANPVVIAYASDSSTVTQTTGESAYEFKVINSLLKTVKVTTDEGENSTEYDSHGYPTKIINNLGVLTKITYNEQGLLVSKTTNADTSDEKITLKSYVTNFRKPSKVVEAGVATFYEYNVNGQLTKKIVGSVSPSSKKLSAQSMNKFSKATLKSSDLDTQESSYEYNDKGLQIGTTQPNGATTANEYDESGNRAKTTNALGFSSETGKFDKAGRPLETKDINGKVSRTIYDNMGRVLTSTNDGQTTTYVYDSNGRTIKTTYSDGLIDEKVYDESGNVIKSFNNQGDKTENSYDANNNLVKTETYKDDVLTNKSKTEYDSKNRVTANIDAQGNRTTYTYNTKGQKTKTMDALNRVTSYEYDSQGRLSKEVNADNKSTLYTYNKEGQKTKVVTPNGTAFNFEYDALKRVTKKLNPDRGDTSYTYDVSGNILTETNAKGELKTYTYDIANRKTSTSYQDNTLNETYEYDQGANAKGKLTKISDASGSLEFSYDADGNMAAKTQTITSVGSVTFTTQYTYDDQNKLTSQTYPSGKVISYSYNSQGEMQSISIDGTAFISDIETNQNGLVSYKYADESTHTREYDTNGRVSKLIYPNYTELVNYNEVNNITDVTADGTKKAFRFDNLDRLTHYNDNTSNDYQNFSYDANGNRLSQNQETNKTRQFTYTANSNTLTGIKYYHRVDENTTNVTKDINYTYDATGNIIKDEKHTYTYDTRNRLTAIDNNVTYQYNYDNRRVSKTVNNVTTYFIYEAHKLIGEYDENANVIKEYIYNGSTSIATTTSSQTYKVYADHLNTSRRVANDTNNIVWKWESSPFGEIQAAGTFTHNLRFPGQYFDSETGTHYNINRDYNPVTGRYIQSDPIGFDGGVNGFGYVGGKPIIARDMNGLKLYFEGLFVNTTTIGIGGELGVGTWFDELTQTEGYFTMAAFSWGVDGSLGYMNGEIDTDTALIDFQGWSKTLAGGLGDFGIAEIYNDKGLIGSIWTVDYSPLPASFTFVRGYTNVFGVSNVLY